MKRVPVNISLYGEFYNAVEDVLVDYYRYNKSFHTALEERTGYNVYHKPSTGIFVLYFTPEDAITFKLKYKKYPIKFAIHYA